MAIRSRSSRPFEHIYAREGDHNSLSDNIVWSIYEGPDRALWVIAFTRMRCDKETKVYATRRTKEGLSRPEILRCLKRYIAREIFILLRSEAISTG